MPLPSMLVTCARATEAGTVARLAGGTALAEPELEVDADSEAATSRNLISSLISLLRWNGFIGGLDSLQYPSSSLRSTSVWR